MRRTAIYAVKKSAYYNICSKNASIRNYDGSKATETGDAAYYYVSSHTAGVLLYMYPRCGVLLMQGPTIYVPSVLLYMCPQDACKASAAGDAAYYYICPHIFREYYYICVLTYRESTTIYARATT